MEQPDIEAVAACAEGAWEWVLQQVRHDADGPWIPVEVPVSGGTPTVPAKDRDCLYDGIAGLAPALAEVRLARGWTDSERSLTGAIVERLAAGRPGGDCSLYDGLAGSLAAVALLDPSATGPLLARLGDLATSAGWPSPAFGAPSRPVNDVVLGNAGIVLACGWLAGDDAAELVAVGADALLRTARAAPRGLAWKMVESDRDRSMPNYSHGTAGVATALAVAGNRLGRPDLVEAARLGAEHLVDLADVGDDGFRLPLQLPAADDREPYAYGWCHGPTGTANLFGALRLAGVPALAGRPCDEWVARAARSVRASGLPDRVRPGFWDNDGRCCGTAGVLEATLDRWQDRGEPADAAFADRLVAALLGRAVASPTDPRLRVWRFREHRADPPERDPGVGWMQGAAGIAAALSRYVRVRTEGRAAPRVAMPDSWWMVRESPSRS